MNILKRIGRHALAPMILLACLVPALAGNPPTAAPRPNPEIQALIEKAVVAIVRGDKEVDARFDELRDPAIGSRQTVLLQLALYLEISSGTERSMGGALILNQLAFTPNEKLETVLPHLDTAAPALRHVFTELLSTIDRPEGGEPDFSYYETRLMKDKDAPPWALIRYLYEVSPDAALLSMERVYDTGPTRHQTPAILDELRKLLAQRESGAALTDSDRARARTTLESLARDTGWWRRLYAAHILAANPDLATPEMRQRLKEDANPLVGATQSR